MNQQEAIDQLKRIFVPFPSFKDFLRATDDADASLRAWGAILTACDAKDVSDVVDEICSGERAAVSQYQKPDMLPRNIREEAVDRRSKRNTKERQINSYHKDLSHMRGSDPKLGVYWREAVRLGEAVRDGEIDCDENDDKLEIMSNWYRGIGPAPSWLRLPGSIVE